MAGSLDRNWWGVTRHGFDLSAQRMVELGCGQIRFNSPLLLRFRQIQSQRPVIQESSC